MVFPVLYPEEDVRGHILSRKMKKKEKNNKQTFSSYFSYDGKNGTWFTKNNGKDNSFEY
jgi:hypothetical protein